MAEYTIEHMVKGKSSRGIRPVGEVFRIDLTRGGHLFGRVVVNDVADAGCLLRRMTPPWPPQPGRYLVYFYKRIRADAQIPSLVSAKDVWAVEVLNPTSWTHGYFRPVRVDPVGSYEELPQHVLYVPNVTIDRQYDDYFCDPWGHRIINYVGSAPEMNISGYMSVDAMIGRLIA